MALRLAKHHPAHEALPRWLASAGYPASKLDDLDAAGLAELDAVIVGVSGKGEAPLRAIDALRVVNPTARVLVLAERRAAATALASLGHGASYVLAWPTSSAAFVLRLAELVQQARGLRDELQRCGVPRPDLGRAAAVSRPLEEMLRLTPRERQILPHMLIGEAHKDVAVNLALAPRMVRFHADNIRGKAGGVAWAEIRAMWLREVGAA